MRDFYSYITLVLFNEESNLLNKLHQAERIMKVEDFSYMSLAEYMKIRIQYEYFKDLMYDIFRLIRYYENL